MEHRKARKRKVSRGSLSFTPGTGPYVPKPGLKYLLPELSLRIQNKTIQRNEIHRAIEAIDQTFMETPIRELSGYFFSNPGFLDHFRDLHAQLKVNQIHGEVFGFSNPETVRTIVQYEYGHDIHGSLAFYHHLITETQKRSAGSAAKNLLSVHGEVYRCRANTIVNAHNSSILSSRERERYYAFTNEHSGKSLFEMDPRFRRFGK